MVVSTRFRLGTRGQPEESRAAILMAAINEFAEHGIAGARTDAIARSARVNKALLYYYFKDKDALQYLGAYFDFIAGNPQFPRVVQSEWMRNPGPHTTRMQRIAREYFRPIYQKLVEVLQQGIAAEEFRPVSPMHFLPSMVAIIVFYFSAAPVIKTLMQVDPLTPERIAERRAFVLDFISAALFTSPQAAQGGARS